VNILKGIEVLVVDKTNIMAEFCIVADVFEPNIATELLQIDSTESWVKGEEIKGKNRNRIDSCWTISTGYEESLDINKQLNKVLSLIENKKDELLKLKSEYLIDFVFAIVVNIEENQSPSMYFNSSFIEFANSINAEFYIDLYVFS